MNKVRSKCPALNREREAELEDIFKCLKTPGQKQFTSRFLAAIETIVGNNVAADHFGIDAISAGRVIAAYLKSVQDNFGPKGSTEYVEFMASRRKNWLVPFLKHMKLFVPERKLPCVPISTDRSRFRDEIKELLAASHTLDSVRRLLELSRNGTRPGLNQDNDFPGELDLIGLVPDRSLFEVALVRFVDDRVAEEILEVMPFIPKDVVKKNSEKFLNDYGLCAPYGEIRSFDQEAILGTERVAFRIKEADLASTRPDTLGVCLDGKIYVLEKSPDSEQHELEHLFEYLILPSSKIDLTNEEARARLAEFIYNSVESNHQTFDDILRVGLNLAEILDKSDPLGKVRVNADLLLTVRLFASKKKGTARFIAVRDELYKIDYGLGYDMIVKPITEELIHLANNS